MEARRRTTLFLVLLCVAWSGQAGLDESLSDTLYMQERERLAQAVNDFGFKLTARMMKENVNTNVVISPIGVAGLLAMTLLGSVGNAYDELAETLGFSQDILSNRQNHEQLGNLLTLLNGNGTSQTQYADAVFLDQAAHIREVYRDFLKRVYHGDAMGVDFRNVDSAKELINEWVKSHTNGNIKDFLQQPLSVNTQVVLLSALYFSGQWARPFLPDYTRKMAFKKPSSDVMVDLMLNVGEFNYTYSVQDGLHIIAFPYNDSTTTMYVLKPLLPKGPGLQDLLDRLDYEKINTLTDRMTTRDCVVRFPKMELKTKANLEDSLKALGVKSIFSPSDANFALMIDSNKVVNRSEESLIARINSGEVEQTRGLKDKLNSLPNPGVYVDSVLHDVKITINEFGTEAAAATSGVLARSAELFYADSPFYMFIRNERTKLVTFSAAIFDPTT